MSDSEEEDSYAVVNIEDGQCHHEDEYCILECFETLVRNFPRASSPSSEDDESFYDDMPGLEPDVVVVVPPAAVVQQQQNEEHELHPLVIPEGPSFPPFIESATMEDILTPVWMRVQLHTALQEVKDKLESTMARNEQVARTLEQEMLRPASFYQGAGASRSELLFPQVMQGHEMIMEQMVKPKATRFHCVWDDDVHIVGNGNMLASCMPSWKLAASSKCFGPAEPMNEDDMWTKVEHTGKFEMIH